jgi:hypothetical protein
MPFHNTRQHKQALQQALLCLDKEGFPDTVLIRDFTDDLKNNRIFDVVHRDLPGAISTTTIRNWRNADLHDDHDNKWEYQKAKAMFNFLERSSKYQTDFINEMGVNASSCGNSRLVLSLGPFIGAKYDPLQEKLTGNPFAMFRKAWFRRDKGETYIRSIVQFTKKHDVITYTERQHYIDTASSVSILEEDEGFVFSFDGNIVIFSKEKSNQTLKILAAHEFRPSLKSTEELRIIRGTLLGIHGSGPHPGYRFVMKRIINTDIESRVYTEPLDKDTHEYLNNIHPLYDS